MQGFQGIPGQGEVAAVELQGFFPQGFHELAVVLEAGLVRHPGKGFLHLPESDGLFPDNLGIVLHVQGHGEGDHFPLEPIQLVSPITGDGVGVVHQLLEFPQGAGQG